MAAVKILTETVIYKICFNFAIIKMIIYLQMLHLGAAARRTSSVAVWGGSVEQSQAKSDRAHLK